MNHWFTWFIMPGVVILLASQIVYECMKSKPDTSAIAILTTILCIYFIPATVLLMYAKLTVVIDKKGISYGWNIPTKELNVLSWDAIDHCHVITHNCIGNGYKLTKKYGMAYTTKGRQGLQIVTKGGEKILLGTLQANDMKNTLALSGFLTE